ncbi:MAG: LysM peptidoglycan-binding domain-containing protein [Anaerolineales bacterium]
MRFTIRSVIAVAALAYLFSARPAHAQQTTHTVQPGENLFRIGLKYGVSWQALRDANGLAGTTIFVGQQLIIPEDGVITPPTPTPEPDPAPQPSPAPQPISGATYTVQRGDTLFRIATRLGVNMWELAAANQIRNPSLLYIGQVLVIPGAGQPPAPPPTGGGKRILIDISEQHLYAYEGEILVFSFVASTGSPGLDTRPGNYAVQSKIPNAYGGNWNIWMPNWLGIYWAGNLENGIHALPILPGGGRLWEGYLGTPVSYGCIILGIAEAQQLWDWAEIGVPVDIQY